MQLLSIQDFILTDINHNEKEAQAHVSRCNNLWKCGVQVARASSHTRARQRACVCVRVGTGAADACADCDMPRQYYCMFRLFLGLSMHSCQGIHVKSHYLKQWLPLLNLALYSIARKIQRKKRRILLLSIYLTVWCNFSYLDFITDKIIHSYLDL